VKQPEEMSYGEKRANIWRKSRTLVRTWRHRGEALEESMLPVVLGGTIPLLPNTVWNCGALQEKGKEDRFDLVGRARDINTPESSPSGNVHGMPLAAAMGYGAIELVELQGFKPKVEPQNISLVGIRDLDTQEKKLAKKSGVHVFTMRDIDERGMREVMSDALKYAMDDTDGISVSLDMDFVDPSDAPASGRRCAVG